MLNVVCLMGRLGSDPELKYTPNQVAVTSFSIAVQRSYQPKNGQERQADWIDIVARRNTAEFITKYFKKGSMIIVQSSIQTRSYTDKQGSKRAAVEVVADNVFFGGGKNNGDAVQPIAQDASVTTDNDDFEEIVGDDELPFLRRVCSEYH